MARPLRILIVEDSEDDALLLLRELRKGGFEPHAQRVDSAEAMQTALRDGAWDVIISDHAMPQFSALAALQIYQAQGLDIPFIIVSGAIGEAMAVEAMRSGAHDYVLKDNLARLTAAIERELQEATERRARRRAEEEAARAGKEWSDTFDAMPSAVCLLGLDYRILRANRLLAEITGRAVEALVGESYPHLMWGQTDLPAELLVAPDEYVDVSFSQVAPDRTFEVRLHPLLDSAGYPRAYVQVARDVTETRQWQAQLLQTQKLAALGEVISGIAHELNNPLAAVVVNAQLLRRHNVSPDIEEDARAVEESALRASRVVHSLLAFARQREPQRVPLDLNQVVEDTLALRAAPLRADNIEVVMELAVDLPSVLGDASQLQQVLLNLINNAQHAMSGTETRRLTLCTEHLGERLHLHVRDTGIGIPEANLSRIFEPFFTTQEVGKGTGLGLSVCHGIIQDHGGDLRVKSTVGVGTDFLIELPVTHLPRTVSAPETTRVALPEGTRVLVVEDEMLIRIALQQVLQDLQVLAEDAPTAAHALRLLEHHSYDAVICDLKMPGMDGKQFYWEACVRWPQLADRFIFCTGDTLNPETLAFIQETGARLLPKPFLMEDVRMILTSLLMPERA